MIHDANLKPLHQSDTGKGQCFGGVPRRRAL